MRNVEHFDMMICFEQSFFGFSSKKGLRHVEDIRQLETEGWEARRQGDSSRWRQGAGSLGQSNKSSE